MPIWERKITLNLPQIFQSRIGISISLGQPERNKAGSISAVPVREDPDGAVYLVPSELILQAPSKSSKTFRHAGQ